MDMNVTYEVHQMMKLFCAQKKKYPVIMSQLML